MGREALQAAVANYRGEVWSDDHEEGELICKCFGIDKPLIQNTVRANGLTTIEDVINYTKAGGGCSTCHEKIEEVLNEVMAEEGFKPRTVETVVEKEEPAPQKKLTNLQRIRLIEEVIDELRPALKADKGDIELIDVDGNSIYVKLVGSCSGCQMAAMTLGGIQQRLVEKLGEFVRLIPV
jgi:NifU-like protein